MKFYRSYILPAAMAIAFLTGCSDSDDWTPGPQDTDTGVRAYFEMPSKSSFIFDSDAAAEDLNVEIIVSRAITDGSVSIPLTLKPDAEGFSLVTPAAEFAAGEGSTTVIVNCAGLPKGVKESFTLSLPADQTDTYGEGLLSVGYSVIKAQWIVASDQVTYSYNDAGNNRTYPNTYGILYQLEGTKMFRLEDFFGSGLDVMFECEQEVTGGQGVVFKPLNNADFYDYGDGYPGWYLYDEETQTYPEWVPGDVAGYSAIDNVSFESDIDYTTVYMNYDKETGYSYIYFTTYVTQTDGNEGWGIWYATFNLDKYNPFE
ncbi:MAG: hypothetical protein K2H72_00550 [Muribaculaceae bacterium]|nr:hypothetical protein [Muribaculaceae bacterium]